MIQTKGNNIFVKVSGPPLTIDERVTIIIPCYKQAKFVKEALDSCLKQTRKPKQIIILLMDVDSWKLKDTLRARDPCIRVICSGRKLLPSARNFCFGLATTEFVIPLDADDTLELNFIEETRKIDADVVYVGTKYFGAEEGFWPPDHSEEIDWDKQTTFRRNPIPCTALIKRNVWAEVGGYSDTLTAFEDMEFWIRLHEKGFVLKKCFTTLLNYRKHLGGSMLQAAKDRRPQLLNEIIELHPTFYGRIPKILHYVWLGNAPKPLPIIEAWRKILPNDWLIKEWNETNLDLTSPYACQFLREAYTARKFGIAVDPIRAYLLYTYGGWWSDTDSVLKKDISCFCQYDLIVGHESERWVMAGLMGARKGSPIMKQILDYYTNLFCPKSIFYNQDEFIRLVGSGPKVLTDTLQSFANFEPTGFPQTLMAQGEKIRIEPACTFVLDDENHGAFNYAVHLYDSSWATLKEPWSKVVERSYENWKQRVGLTLWRG